MIRYYITEKNELKEIESYIPKCWVNSIKPDENDVIKLKELGIDEDFIYDALDPEERARFEQDEDIIYIITKIPFFDADDPEVPFKTLPLGIAITPEAIITISDHGNEILNDFLNKKVKDFSTKKRFRFLLRIFDRGTVYYLRYLKDIRKRSNDIENELHRSTRNKELVAMLNLEKSLVYFTTSLRSNELMFEKLKRANILTLYEEDEELFEDIIIENRQAIEMARIYSDILSGMMDAFASVISNNLNVVMKILTIVTLVLQIPMLTASIYGMNIALPLQESPYAFYLTMGVSGVIAVIFGFALFKIRWFK
ncbi:magnesium transporter CorA family protein [Kosmotoga pacifica]|uniref:Magnesium transporter CorA n=1 Tax=Kosmotoga pacifica TaxID=1330330 RepID=A0A0G2ZBK0_9BACT|nr:magnesium transporter CorA family protein [Kosmotoga pacifica]AKI97441.1 magnesium transporter CorA [Kosmotoga pacifica]